MLTSFDLVAKHGGYSRAARSSQRSKATLSRHVAELEEHLGLRLLERDGRGFALTEHGRRLYERTHDLLAELQEAVTALGHDRGPPRGKLRVSCPMMFGHMVMGRLAAGFHRHYPAVELEVTVEERMVDLIEENYDVVIRINPRADAQLTGRCIVRDALHLAAPAQWVRPVDPEAAIPALMTPASPPQRIVDCQLGDQRQALRLNTVLRLPTPLLQRDAVLAGAGVAILPFMLMRGHVARGEMQDWGAVDNAEVTVWALHTGRRLTSAKVRAFLEYLDQQSAAGPLF